MRSVSSTTSAEIFATRLLSPITKEQSLVVLSPFATMQQLTQCIFGLPRPYKFETYWAATAWAALVILGWLVVAWKHPRVRGEERASD